MATPVYPPYSIQRDVRPIDFATLATEVGTGDVSPVIDQNNEIKRLESQHPLYADYKPLWDYYLSAFEGGKAFANQENIHKHRRENDEDYRDRVKRAHYFNYCEPLTTFFTDFIFSETIQRDGGAQQTFFTNFIQDVTLRGDDITDFMSEASDDMQIFGMAYGLCDAPPKPADIILTKADDAVLRPYWVLIRPTEILDWGVNQFEQFTYVKRKQLITEVGERGQRKNIIRYTEWTPDTITISDYDKTDVNNPRLTKTVTVNELGVVPIEVVRFKRSKTNPYMGVSFLVDFADNNKEVMNLTSLEQEFLYKQCFNVLAMESPDLIADAQAEDQEIGTANVLEYPRGGKAPSYITPSADPAKEIRTERREIISEMYRRAAQDTVNELFNGGGSSGFSKAQSFRTTVPRIATRAEVLEKFEKKMFALTYAYTNATFDGSVKYRDHYEITNLADTLAQMQTLFSDLLIPSSTFIKEEMLKVVSQFDGKISPKKMQLIIEEIESANWDEYQDTMKLKSLGRGATSPDVSLAFGDQPATASDMATKGKDTQTSASTAQKPTQGIESVAASSKQQPKK